MSLEAMEAPSLSAAAYERPVAIAAILGVPDLDLTGYGFGRVPFRPVYRWVDKGYFEVLVKFKGKAVWMESIQDSRSQKF